MLFSSFPRSHRKTQPSEKRSTGHRRGGGREAPATARGGEGDGMPRSGGGEAMAWAGVGDGHGGTVKGPKWLEEGE